MREAIISVRDGDGTALGLADVMAVVRAAGLEDLEVMTCEGARGVVRVTVRDPVDEARLSELPAIVWFERVAGPDPDCAYLVEFDVRDTPGGIAACDDDLVRCETLDVGEDGFVFDVAGPKDAIADTVAEYEAAGAEVQLQALQDVGRRRRPLDALTARQREVMEVALDTGYFDVPRDASTAEVAAELDLDSSTVAEHIQRAQRNLVSSVFSPTPAST